MGPTNTVLTKDPITAFCELEIAKRGDKWPPSEDNIATDFIEFFEAKNCALYPQLENLCARLSIELSLSNLPESHSGFNCAFGDRRAIVVNKAELVGLNREHALLHELREILEYKFQELNRPIAVKNDLEVRAEMFAVTVRMYSGFELWSSLADLAKGADAPWKRFIGYLLVGAGVLAHFYSTIYPVLEYVAKQQLLTGEIESPMKSSPIRRRERIPLTMELSSGKISTPYSIETT